MASARPIARDLAAPFELDVNTAFACLKATAKPIGVTQGLAESLAGLMLVDASSPGYPCIFALMPFISDLRTGAMTGGGGEAAMANAAAAQVLAHLGLPSTVSAGMLGTIMVASPEMLVIDNDMCGAILRSVRRHRIRRRGARSRHDRQGGHRRRSLSGRAADP